jgi:hypothetical protein
VSPRTQVEEQTRWSGAPVIGISPSDGIEVIGDARNDEVLVRDAYEIRVRWG